MILAGRNMQVIHFLVADIHHAYVCNGVLVMIRSTHKGKKKSKKKEKDITHRRYKSIFSGHSMYSRTIFAILATVAPSTTR
jgi:uncharacterized membrane protein